MTQATNGTDKGGRDLEVITTHVNADYDALASMLAAAKLYPEALLILPGAQERNLRNFFVESTCYLYNFVKLREVDFGRVKRLVMVDTRQADRIGPLEPLARDPTVEIHVYDHHPDSPDDVKAAKAWVEPVGSTVTLLSRLLRERQVELSEDEATLLALGIYEDTGSFSFSSTTERDFEAAGWLLSQGANLNLVSSLITRELTAEEVGLLNDLMRSAYTINLRGVEVVVSEVGRERYVPEFAVLVHKFMDGDNLDAVIALARMEGRIYLVARSRIPEVDAGVIASAFGGGGHPSAASATVRGLTMVEARERLRSVLEAHVNPTRLARDLMTGPVVSVSPETSLEEAHRVMNRYGLSLLPVVKGGEPLGLISNDIVEKAIHHGLGQLTAVEYMDPKVVSLGPEASLAEVEQALVGEKRLMVLVRDEARLLGVITREDYIDAILDQPEFRGAGLPGPLGDERNGRHKIVAGLLRERLPKPVVAILRELGTAAAGQGGKAYLVGGSVRDIFLRRENLDLDLVVEGDAMALARAYAKEHPTVRVRVFRKFNTAKLIYEDGLSIDLATARLEYYQAPAALPTVELSSLRLDLYRRDFTINTLAISLAPDEFGQLFDFFDGLKDLKSKAIRVMHNLSFVEDPTRIFRAVRFEQRFGFTIGRFTEGLIKNALKINAVERLSGDRLFGEFRQMMDEERAGDCLLRLEDLKLLGVFHPRLAKLTPRQTEMLEEVSQAVAWYRLSFLDQPVRQWLVYLLLLADPLKDVELIELLGRLGLAPKLKVEISELRRQMGHALNTLQRTPPSNAEIFRELGPLRPAYLIFIMAKAQKDWVKRAVSKYLTQLRHTRPELTGEDLKALGFRPGPVFKRILDRLLLARLDEEVAGRVREEELVLAEFGQYRQERT